MWWSSWSPLCKAPFSLFSFSPLDGTGPEAELDWSVLQIFGILVRCSRIPWKVCIKPCLEHRLFLAHLIMRDGVILNPLRQVYQLSIFPATPSRYELLYPRNMDLSSTAEIFVTAGHSGYIIWKSSTILSIIVLESLIVFCPTGGADKNFDTTLLV